MAVKMLSLITTPEWIDRWDKCVRVWETVTDQTFKTQTKTSAQSPSTISYGLGYLPISHCKPPTALHFALGLGHWKTSAQLLTHGHPEGISPIALCRKGMLDESNPSSKLPILPLHIALANDVPLHLITLLLTTAVDAAQALVGSKSTPLHIAVASMANKAVVKAVLDAWPEALYKTDHEGRTPLDLAQHGADAVVNFLRGAKEGGHSIKEGDHDDVGTNSVTKDAMNSDERNVAGQRMHFIWIV